MRPVCKREERGVDGDGTNEVADVLQGPSCAGYELIPNFADARPYSGLGLLCFRYLRSLPLLTLPLFFSNLTTSFSEVTCLGKGLVAVGFGEYPCP